VGEGAGFDGLGVAIGENGVGDGVGAGGSAGVAIADAGTGFADAGVFLLAGVDAVGGDDERAGTVNCGGFGWARDGAVSECVADALGVVGVGGWRFRGTEGVVGVDPVAAADFVRV